MSLCEESLAQAPSWEQYTAVNADLHLSSLYVYLGSVSEPLRSWILC